MPETDYGGVIVPLITPFTNNGKIDETSVKKIVGYVVKNNCSPFVLGTTGESASINVSSYKIVANTMVKATEGKCKTYAGISSNNFESTINLASEMRDIGVDALVVHPPSYYPLSADHILKYYEKLADTVKMPLLIYNIPVTTHHSIPLDVVDKLSHHPNIIGIKDSERNLERMRNSIEMWSSRNDFVHLLGWGAEFSNALLMGSDGIVPGTGNIAPHLYHMMFQQVKNGNKENVWHLQKITDQFSQIYQKDRLLSESLAALKVMLNQLDLCERSVLPPLLELNEDDVRGIVKRFNDLKEQMKSDPFGEKITWS